MLVDYVRGLYERYGYQEIITPQIFSTELWKRSGHYDNYIENMYLVEAEEQEYGVKPMNCPGHALLYAAELHSYRDLPLRYADFGRLHRNERSGVTHGLTRVRSFSQDDAHIFCTQEQIASEVAGFVAMASESYRVFGFDDVRVVLSLRPEKRVGADEVWDRAEAALAGVLRELDLAHETAPGEGAFYGPKIDFFVPDAIGREWQLGTVQLDFSMPERFDLQYAAEDGSLQRPVMVHRAMLGSLERFLGVLIEHYGGAFPLWLAPVQATVIPIADRHIPYARSTAAELRAQGFRVHVDERGERMQAKIRDAQMQKTPYMLVAGDREAAAGLPPCDCATARTWGRYRWRTWPHGCGTRWRRGGRGGGRAAFACAVEPRRGPGPSEGHGVCVGQGPRGPTPPHFPPTRPDIFSWGAAPPTPPRRQAAFAAFADADAPGQLLESKGSEGPALAKYNEPSSHRSPGDGSLDCDADDGRIGGEAVAAVLAVLGPEQRKGALLLGAVRQDGSFALEEDVGQASPVLPVVVDEDCDAGVPGDVAHAAQALRGHALRLGVEGEVEARGVESVDDGDGVGPSTSVGGRQASDAAAFRRRCGPRARGGLPWAGYTIDGQRRQQGGVHGRGGSRLRPWVGPPARPRRFFGYWGHIPQSPCQGGDPSGLPLRFALTPTLSQGQGDGRAG